MPAVTIRNLSEEAHRALKVRAAHHGRSAEAEMRDILETAVRPANRIRLGSALSALSREAGLTNADFDTLDLTRDRTPAEPMRFRMIVLDTNVVSEAMKPEPDLAVRDWLDAQAAETLFLSSITVAELLFGVGALPEGRRKQKLVATLDGLLDLFDGRILPFDTDAARHYADLAVAARNAGKGFPTPDGYIAAVAGVRGFTVATRDATAFAAAGIAVIDPWKAGR